MRESHVWVQSCLNAQCYVFLGLGQSCHGSALLLTLEDRDLIQVLALHKDGASLNGRNVVRLLLSCHYCHVHSNEGIHCKSEFSKGLILMTAALNLKNIYC
ncbi:hypothetical protein MJO28_008670 [Puccinia striiformis f. sp. tritici]|uniref:Uncharacterized protein n=3 Tax=Puccinia striiformis TaxID=27350 RepID=A0A2S4WEQ1_9BASI|nr:hypothetical protein MJO28_008670 [Puccinia striiformis f. sp. tritici]POV95437.1 hypothetical protein PSHT_15652 [Puccinia striiformis]POW00175.1 hypothetical protein PSTT_13288 [Puccinia striiformis]POW20208.1 hypothetical protein PSHT_03740 [Puccinia striiformis]